jgi:Mg/Co/Ni transporter MgtE
MAAAEPRTAAAILQILPSGQAAHAIEHLNPDTAAALLGCMRPDDAARMLNRVSVRAVAGVIMALPSAGSAALVKAMPNDRLARVLELVRPANVADLLQSGDEFGSTLLNLLSTPAREQVLRQLPRGRRIRHRPG